MTRISDKKVGDTVTVKDLATQKGTQYIVIHKGRPSDLYSANSNGVWLMRKIAIGSYRYATNGSNDFSTSEAMRFLNNEYASCGLQYAANEIRIPYYDTVSKTVKSGDNGVSVKIFLLSATEVGFHSPDDAQFPVIGNLLTYFQTNNRATTYSTGANAQWYLRTSHETNKTKIYSVGISGNLLTLEVNALEGLRPVFVAENSLFVSDNNVLIPNLPPDITTDKSGDLGTLTDGFTCNYSVTDVDENDPLNISLKLDGRVVESFAGVHGRQETYTLGGEEWLKLANGQHTFTISVNDEYNISESTAKFTRNCTSLTLSLSQPLNTENLCGSFYMKITGNIPNDADVKYEACNNANDDEPAWEDISQRVKTGLTHVFQNKASVNGPAVSFRITAKRGSTNSPGFIEKIVCGYE